ncbi:protein kinase, putative [Trypanosoma equiperdum]|uniref:Protein kinase, putative n=2 Tax=Trypanozoon TaxID=39700 RepID=Q57WV2_TRYB2|nr:protein kinase, putative [Trypanosoma brucei brucei TREU927]AAX69915.1 protein kinase, putative [Trypanosoma brucei]AAZ10106.1 protein kinase, putative [Trypanosoma brucei brucei TREU927]SCU71203.1 protein kinase, putative [Trypanosoma equiperdum]
MENYQLLNQLGDGTFGCVVKALHKSSGQFVAIKKMKQKYYSWDECMKLPEVVVVRRVHGHPNIVKMREVIREKNELFFVFEFMDGDLLGVIRRAKQMQSYGSGTSGPALAYPKIKSYTFQILQSLAYLHRAGYFHRDMKPENLLVRKDPSTSAQEIVKLADFGLVKEIRARPPYTDYVSTRWYRAPELLLQDRCYSSPVDIWAVGCIIAEMITTRPLFAGSNEVDQLHKIMAVLGSPNESVWPNGMVLAKKIRYNFPSINGVGLERVMPPHVPPHAMDLMKQMLNYDPKRRPTAQQCLQHPYFNVGVDEENFAPTNVPKQMAEALKKHTSGPQSAPSGAVVPNSDTKGDRPPVGATTAVPKAGGPSNSPPVVPQQNSYSPSNESSDRKPDVQPKFGSNVKTTLANMKTSPLPPEAKPGKFSPSNNKEIPSRTVAQPPPASNNDELDLDGLIDDFAGELKTLGLHPQQKQHGSTSLQSNATPGKDITNCGSSGSQRKSGVDFAKPPPMEGGMVATLLNSTRYKLSSFQSSENKTYTNSLGKAHPQGNSPATLASVGPSVGSQAVSPSIKALLAKHREHNQGSNS